MPLSFLSGGSLSDLIGKKKQDRAIEQLRNEIKAAPRDTRTRLQLADLLVSSGRAKEAVPILLKIAEEFARDGAAAKAISVLKKAQKAQPGRADIAAALAKIIQKSAPAPASNPATRTVLKPVRGVSGAMEFEMEEIALDVRVADSIPEPEVEVVAEDLLPPPVAVAAPIEKQVESKPLGAASIVSAPPLEESPAAPLPPPVAVSAPEHEPDGPGLLDDLLDTIETVLAEAPPAKTASAPKAAVSSPLFSDFTSDELVAVIAGLNLQTYDAGDILITEGEPGDSLFVVTGGEVKAFVRQTNGRHRFVRGMGEGSFFGEISILTGQKRTATVTARTPAEVLVLDRATLDSICERHPGVRTTLERFANERKKTIR
jgi:CRP-like cAMP-binding protein